MFDIDLNSIDFDHARHKALWNRIIDGLTFHQNKLLDLEDVLAQCHLTNQSDLGLRTVPLAHVVGSIGRSRDFDRSFMPRQKRTKDRWLNVNRAYYRDVPLPPLELEQVGDNYFVVDGHHRISVARIHGQQYAEAHVIQHRAQCDEEASNHG